jgi:hypothetical protein
VEIFDLKGTSQGVILDLFLEAGNHAITPDLKNLASGVYFIIISTSDTSITQKMTLLK